MAARDQNLIIYFMSLRGKIQNECWNDAFDESTKDYMTHKPGVFKPMTTAPEVAKVLREFTQKYGIKETYDEDECIAIQHRLRDVATIEHKMKRFQLEDIGKQNYFAMPKWAEHFPRALVECAGQYWDSIKVWSPGADPRFQLTNQTERCKITYIEYHKCMDQLQDESECEYFKRVYNAVCPQSWVEEFDEQFENGVLHGYHEPEYI